MEKSNITYRKKRIHSSQENLIDCTNEEPNSYELLYVSTGSVPTYSGRDHTRIDELQTHIEKLNTADAEIKNLLSEN